MASNVRVIPATIHRTSAQSSHPTSNRRTAAYARVSTDSEEQLTSYEAQVDYYTKYIKERPDWSLSVSTLMKVSVQSIQKNAMASTRWWLML